MHRHVQLVMPLEVDMITSLPRVETRAAETREECEELNRCERNRLGWKEMSWGDNDLRSPVTPFSPGLPNLSA